MKIYEFTEKELHLLQDALKEYEKDYYSTYEKDWQKIINNLIKKIN